MKPGGLKRTIYRFTTFFAAAGLVLGVIKILQSPFFSVKKVTIFLDVAQKESSPLTEDLIRELASVPIGDNLFALDMDLVVSRVRNHDWVADVQVSKRLPNAIDIRVEAKKPIALLQGEKGQLHYLDGQGRSFGEFDLKHNADLPMVNAIPEDKMSEAVAYVKKWEEHPVKSVAELSSLSFSDDQGFQAYVVLKESLHRSSVVLGENCEPETLDQIEKVMQYVGKHRLAVHQIRADVSKKIVVKITRGS